MTTTFDLAFQSAIEKCAAITYSARPGKNGAQPSVSVHAAPDPPPRTVLRKKPSVSTEYTRGATYHSDAAENAMPGAAQGGYTKEKKVLHRTGRKAGGKQVNTGQGWKKPTKIQMSGKHKALLGLAAAGTLAAGVAYGRHSMKPRHEQLGNTGYGETK